MSSKVLIRPLIWHDERAVLSFIILRYIPWLAALNLIWEITQLPLYTLWTDSPASQIVFAVVHCTLGDVSIGTTALIMALIVTRAGNIESWNWVRITAVTTLFSGSYTVFSEWMNTVALESWSYSKLMPVLTVDGLELGMSPLLQWLLLPSLVIFIAQRRR